MFIIIFYLYGLILVAIFSQKSIALSLLAEVLPNPLQCYHIIHDFDNISRVVFNEIQNKNFAVLNSNSKGVMLNKNTTCDFYLLLFNSKQKIINSLSGEGILYKLNKNLTVDTNVILVHNEMNLNHKLQLEIIDKNCIKNLIINILLLELMINESIVQINVLAPISNQTKIFKGQDLLINKYKRMMSVELKNLLKSQAWNPTKRNISLEIAYSEHPTIIYSEDLKPHGVEYRVLKEIISDLNMKSISVDQYMPEVIFICLINLK